MSCARTARLAPITAGLLAAAVLSAAVAGVGTVAASGPADPPLGATLSERDRADLAAPAVRRGAPAPGPAVRPTDAEAVARAYLVAAHTVLPDDADRTHLRAAPYAVPGTGPATVGVLVPDAPPLGAQRRASVESLELVAADRADRRRGYAATVLTTTGPDGPSSTAERYVVLARQDEDRWLVAAESPWSPDLVAGDG